MWKDIKAIIQGHDDFVLTTHVNPDGDGLGAACAMIELLQMQGKRVRFVADSPIPDKFAFLDKHSCFEVYDPSKDWSMVQVLIILDTHRRERIGRLSSLLDRQDVISICIDHHRLEETFTPYSAVDPEACCVGTMVYTLFKEMGYPLNIEAAIGIYASIVCDTGRFSYSSTSRKAHKIADECLRLGVDPYTIYRAIYQQVPLKEMLGFIQSMQTMTAYFDSRLLLIEIPQKCFEDDVQHIDLEFALDIAKQIREVECVAVLRVNGGLCRVSLRSKGAVDVAKVAKALGGGGHGRAAGASLEGDKEHLRQKVLELIGEEIHGVRTLSKS